MNDKEILKNENILKYILEHDDCENTMIILGFADAYLGTTTKKPVRVVYDYWKCLDSLITEGGWEFDEGIEYLDELIEEDFGDGTPLYIKQL
tara:strand:+ start:940 stop:1215 length:276 start_codon:yes stop_codon:yes gene_type:complete